MAWLRRLVNSLASRKLNREVSDEVRSHMEMLEDDLVAQGMNPEDASLEARRRFGNPTLTREKTRDHDLLVWAETWKQDIAYGFRTLWKTPALTTVAVLSLALGIGANTAIFSWMNAILIRNLPVRGPEQLSELVWTFRGWPDRFAKGHRGTDDGQGENTRAHSFPYLTYEALKGARTGAVSDVVAYARFFRPANVVADGVAESVTGYLVSGNFFEGLGLRPAMGRLLTNEDDRPGAPPAAVIGYAYWQRRFAGQPVIGKTILVNNASVEIAGVAPPEFFGLSVGAESNFYLPISMQPRVMQTLDEAAPPLRNPHLYWVEMMVRREPGVSAEQARAALAPVFRQSLVPVGDEPVKPSDYPELDLLDASRGLADVRRQFSTSLTVLMVAVGLVLLISCANIANLLLARATGRSREMAVRAAIGAGRGRLVRQLLTESILLAALGGIAALLVGAWGSQALLRWAPRDDRPLSLDVSLDWNVLLFTAGLSLLTGILFGILPALRASRMDVNSALKSGTLQSGARHRFAKSLVVSQMALSLLLLVGAALFVRTMQNLTRVNLGFNERGLLIFAVEPVQAGVPRQEAGRFHSQLLERLRALPGVENASLTQTRLIANSSWTTAMAPVGETIPKFNDPASARYRTLMLMIDERYHQTMQIPLLQGRSFQLSDSANAPKVALVNEAFARKFFPSGALGRQIRKREGPPVEIVGILANSKYNNIRVRDPQPIVFVPYQQEPDLEGAHYLVRAKGDPLALAKPVRDLVHEMDHRIPVNELSTQEQQVDAHLAEERLFARLSAIFGGLALLLAAIGLYGVLSYVIGRRTQEIGIRIALGADAGGVMRLVFRESSWLLLVGLALGLGLAFFAVEALKTQLYGIQPHDPVAFGIAAAVMAAAALIAIAIPAVRASRVDPLIALRSE
ncbi:MAG: ABC transporter permease [Bryobacteraceae bacterium]|nr:ABC transporter permease [Bryobacteraceae bacterium]